jgi:hypothetical protein
MTVQVSNAYELVRRAIDVHQARTSELLTACRDGVRHIEQADRLRPQTNGDHPPDVAQLRWTEDP